MNKLHFTSLGCSRNLVDSEVMIAKLFDNNFSLSNSIEKADVFVINTCGFLKEARDEAVSILDDIFENKKKSSKVIITGCMANLFSNELKDKYPDVFSILSTGNIDKIFEAIKSSITSIDKLSHIQEKDISRVLTTLPHLAYLKISEGCSKFCTFCIIPKIKGPLKSRSIESILKEFELLLSQGVFEINLIAQDLLDYGKDRNEKNALFTLIKEILKIKKDFWLRLLYVYPDEITPEFIKLLSSDPRICKYIDLPLQHISDRILKKMKRKTSREEIIQIYKKIKAKMPNFSIRSSLMVGFPSESAEDFNELLEFIENYPIDHLAVFKYSNEKHSQSYKLEDQISEDVKQKRFDLLTKKQLSLIQKRNKKFIGKTFEVLLDNYHPESNLLAVARHQGQAFDVDSNIIINDSQNISSFGDLQKVKVVDVSGYDLIASPLNN